MSKIDLHALFTRTLQTLRFDSVRGMLTVPGLIALGGLAAAIIVLQIDSEKYVDTFSYLGFRLAVDPETARTLASTVASASLTTLTLVYSITLLVFTLAAGTVGPRLLQRFTNDRMNQVTAGLLGANFIFSTLVLHRITDEFVPTLSIGLIMVMAIVAVILLIVFVHSVARRVTIDEEVALISSQLDREFERLVKTEAKDAERSRNPRPVGQPHEIVVTRHGYVDYFNEGALLQIATNNNLFIDFAVRPGSFVIKDMQLARVIGDASDEVLSTIRENVVISTIRRPTGDIEFSINLIVEIALRALSPGINDTFTAIACVDRLSSALAVVVRDGLREPTRHDSEGTPRLNLGDFDLDQLLDVGFNPLRRAARNNVLMASHIARALGRLHEIAGPDARPSIDKHIALLAEETNRADVLDVDRDFIRDSATDLRDAA